MSLLLYFALNDFLLILIYIVYHKINIKTISSSRLPLNSSEKIVITDDVVRHEVIKQNKKLKKHLNKQRLSEKRK